MLLVTQSPSMKPQRESAKVPKAYGFEEGHRRRPGVPRKQRPANLETLNFVSLQSVEGCTKGMDSLGNEPRFCCLLKY